MDAKFWGNDDLVWKLCELVGGGAIGMMTGSLIASVAARQRVATRTILSRQSLPGAQNGCYSLALSYNPTEPHSVGFTVDGMDVQHLAVLAADVLPVGPRIISLGSRRISGLLLHASFVPTAPGATSGEGQQFRNFCVRTYF